MEFLKKKGILAMILGVTLLIGVFSISANSAEKLPEVQELMEKMSLEDKVAQMFIITPEALTGVSTVTEAREVTKNAYSRFPVGGIIYFEANILSREQLGEMSSNICDYSYERVGIPAFISTDEEGGRVARLAGNPAMEIPNIGSMKEIGDTGDILKAYRVGTTIGSYLLKNGINLDFAPVADVDTDSNQSVVGDRSFSSNPELASKMVANIVKGLQESGVSAALKHFPGHGSTEGDTHDGYAFTNKTLDEMRQCELIPFEEGIKAGCDFVMVGHISAPNVTGDNIPSSMSKIMITDVLREELGFKGLIVTDALNMGAIAQQFSSDKVAVEAVKAGVDMLLMPVDFQSAYQGILNAVEAGEIKQSRIDDSVKKILELKVKKIADEENLRNRVYDRHNR